MNKKLMTRTTSSVQSRVSKDKVGLEKYEEAKWKGTKIDHEQRMKDKQIGSTQRTPEITTRVHPGPELQPHRHHHTWLAANATDGRATKSSEWCRLMKSTYGSSADSELAMSTLTFLRKRGALEAAAALSFERSMDSIASEDDDDDPAAFACADEVDDVVVDASISLPRGFEKGIHTYQIP
jgi:hypothetical protein